MGTPEFITIIHKQPFQMLKQTLLCHEGCEQLGIMHLLHITPTIKLMDEIIQLNGSNYRQILTGPFGGSIHLLHVP
jgi:hypothetical protein